MINFIHNTKYKLFQFGQQTVQQLFVFAQTTRQRTVVFNHDVDPDMFNRQGIGYWRIESNFEVQ